MKYFYETLKVDNERDSFLKELLTDECIIQNLRESCLFSTFLKD